MAKSAKLISSHGDTKPGEQFLLEYQKCVLIALEKEGLLDRSQLEKCIIILENQSL